MAYVRKTKVTVENGDSELFIAAEPAENAASGENNGEQGSQFQVPRQDFENDTAQESASYNTENSFDEGGGYTADEAGDHQPNRVVVRARPRVQIRDRQDYDPDGSARVMRPQAQPRPRRAFERRDPGSQPHYGASGFNSYGGGGSYPGSAAPNIPPSIAYQQGALPELPKNLPSMPQIYGKPEPRGEDDGNRRLSVNELSRLSMIDLRTLAACYGISHEDLVPLKKQELIFTLLKAHTERGGIIYAYGSLEILPDGRRRITVSGADPLGSDEPARH